MRRRCCLLLPCLQQAPEGGEDRGGAPGGLGLLLALSVVVGGGEGGAVDGGRVVGVLKGCCGKGRGLVVVRIGVGCRCSVRPPPQATDRSLLSSFPLSLSQPRHTRGRQLLQKKHRPPTKQKPAHLRTGPREEGGEAVDVAEELQRGGQGGHSVLEPLLGDAGLELVLLFFGDCYLRGVGGG